MREALVFHRHDRRAGRLQREHRFVEELGGALGDVGPRGADLPYLELAAPAGVADADDPPRRLDPVAGEQRRKELDRLVGAEEALVTVVAHREFGDQISDDPQLGGACDEVAAVVGIILTEAEPDRCGGEWVAHEGITLPKRMPRAGTRTSVPSFFCTK